MSIKKFKIPCAKFHHIGPLLCSLLFQSHLEFSEKIESSHKWNIGKWPKWREKPFGHIPHLSGISRQWTSLSRASLHRLWSDFKVTNVNIFSAFIKVWPFIWMESFHQMNGDKFSLNWSCGSAEGSKHCERIFTIMLSSPFWKSPGALFGNLDFHLPCQALCPIWLKISKSC